MQRLLIPPAQVSQTLARARTHELLPSADPDTTLELSIPGIFSRDQKIHQPVLEHTPGDINRKSIEQWEDNCKDEDTGAGRHVSWSGIRTRCHITHSSSEMIGQQRRPGEHRHTYYNLVKMMFPEVTGIPPLSVDLIDTIFYNADGSMTYVYTDPKRGLLRTKSKNYIDLFLKRKAQVDVIDLPSTLSRFNRRRSVSSQRNSILSLNKTSKDLSSQTLKNLDYVALLRYKDENFIRLKQHEFRSIFIRPMQANQKYKIFNNTHYIQLIPQEVNSEEGTLLNIEFHLHQHIDTALFQTAIDKHLQQTSFNSTKDSTVIKQSIRKTSVTAYLLYIVFEIYAYVNVHYHKHITEGVFEFMRVKNVYYLCNARNLKMDESQAIRNEYARHDLFEDFVEEDEHFNLKQQRNKSGVLRVMEQLFDATNKRITADVKNTVKLKLEEIENKPDLAESNTIFKSINEKCPQTLHLLLDDDRQFHRFLVNKEKQLDGMSPLTSISNICRRKQVASQACLGKAKGLEVQPKDERTKKQLFITSPQEGTGLKKTKYRNLKWSKQVLVGKKEYVEFQFRK